ncbi:MULTISPECIES: NB-ARC domain-containing protein [unclassified Micromonospora]|uniref:NB-ARC domain-containing protein n=1 Tax=unclassified Micromonospora TaxID=2617518 RepID=UPI00363E931E
MGRLTRPLVPAGPLADFYDRLHALHFAAGQPSMRRLQQLTRAERRPRGINPTSIHAAFVRPRLARWEVVGEVVRVLGGDVDEFATLWRQANHWQSHDDGPAGPPPHAPWAPADAAPVPRELPPDVLPFTGRGPVRAALDGLLAEGATRAAMMTVLLTGSTGIGKSALAVHWAHRVAGHFPGGQLYADLRGESPGQPPAPAEVLAAFLNALGVATADLPATPAALAARYRTRMAGRRMLVLLDNASAVEQVRPLLPGSPGCLVLVTSRDGLAELVVRHGARRLELGPLSAEAGVELLRGLIGDRVDADPESAYDLVRRCGGRPLALRVAAERMTAHRTTALATATVVRPALAPARVAAPQSPATRGPPLHTLRSDREPALGRSHNLTPGIPPPTPHDISRFLCSAPTDAAPRLSCTRARRRMTRRPTVGRAA